MSPIKTSKSDGKQRYSIPVLGDLIEKLSENLDVSELDGSDWLDADGYLKAGTPLRLSNGKLLPISGGGQTARGVLLETTKVADDNVTATLDATDDFDVVIVVNATLDRGIMESNKGSALSADEVSAIDANDALVMTSPVS